MRNKNRPEIQVRSAEQLGNAIQRIRRLLELNQTQLGEKASIKQQSVSTLEKGAPGARLETVFKLLAALDLELVVRFRKRGQD